MCAREATEDHPVTDGDVTSQRGVVGEYTVVTDVAVVSDMGIRQYPVVIAN